MPAKKMVRESRTIAGILPAIIFIDDPTVPYL
jgi:hypothetical protein